MAIVVAGLIGLGLSTTLLDAVPSEVCRIIAITWLLAIGCSLLADWNKGGLRNLMRLDIFALLAYFFLLYFEFLFPQEGFNNNVIPIHLATATQAINLGLIGMAVGRHLVPKLPDFLKFTANLKLSPLDLFLVYLGCFALAYLHQWLAVSFNPVEWIDRAMGARFSQPWGRGKYGSLSTLLNEFMLLAAVIPPLAGLMFSNWKRYPIFMLVVVAIICLLNFFLVFISGTRNVFAVQMAGFLGGYFISQPKLYIWKLGIGAVLSAVIFTIAADHMLSFRNMGFKRYIEEGHYIKEVREIHQEYFSEGNEETYFVDANIYNISMLAEVFPSQYDFIGFNLFYVAATKPIPRAIWSGKPKDLDVGLEEAVGVSGMTISATFAGEAFMAYGLFGSILVGVFIGAFSGFWNQFGSNLTSPFPLLLFASGFPPVMGFMRSVMFFTTALLPALALLAFGLWLSSIRKR